MNDHQIDWCPPPEQPQPPPDPHGKARLERDQGRFTARSNWRKTIEGAGGHCPVCDRWGRIYARTINRTMARSLVWLCRMHPSVAHEEWVDVPHLGPRWLVRSNQLPTLAWWNLVERCPHNDNPKVKHSGLWRPTGRGVEFYRGHITVPAKVYTYNNVVQGFSDARVALQQCFRDDFDYQHTMSDLSFLDRLQRKESD